MGRMGLGVHGGGGGAAAWNPSLGHVGPSPHRGFRGRFAFIVTGQDSTACPCSHHTERVTMPQGSRWPPWGTSWRMERGPLGQGVGVGGGGGGGQGGSRCSGHPPGREELALGAELRSRGAELRPWGLPSGSGPPRFWNGLCAGGGSASS